MEEKTANSLFEEMKDDVTSYVKNTIELGKLEAYDKASRGSSILAFIVTILFLGLFSLALILTTAGLYLGEVLDSNWQGFGIITLVTIGIVALAIAFKKKIKEFVANAVVEFLMDSNDPDEKGVSR